MKVRELYSILFRSISDISSEADSESRWIIEELTGKKFEYLIVENPLVELTDQQVNEIITKRVKERIPLQYIFHKAFFYGFELYVDDRVLIPRGDTEVIVEYTIKNFQARHLRWLDLATGSGAIAIALDKFLGGDGFASDHSLDALIVARQNAIRHHCNFVLLASDLLFSFKENTFDLIVSNPPYVGEKEKNTLPPEVCYEPQRALFGGHEGFEMTEKILSEALRVLVPGGSIIIETSPGSFEKLRKRGIMELFHFQRELFDLSGELRGLHLIKRN